MKKILYLIILISILSISTLVSAGIIDTTSGIIVTDTSYIKISLVNQNPVSAVPGDYVELLFKVENRGTSSSNNVTLELIPEYPFSLDPGVNAVNNLGTVSGLQSGNNAFLVKYKVKVDKDAVDGDNEIKLRYSENSASAYYTQAFNVSVMNPRTDFDVVFQDSTDLAIVNVGANTAQSVIVKIPEQPNFRVNGTSATIIGNLNAGDYTLVTFQLSPVRTSNTSSGENNLTVEISYTDTLGIRRTIQKNVSYGFGTSGFNGNATERFTQRGQSSTYLLGSNGLTYIAIGVVGIVIVVAVLKLRKRKKK